MTSKKAFDWPMKRPIAVKNFTTPMAIPLVSVGRMMEHFGSDGLRNGHGSGMMRLVVNSSPPNGAALRFGNVSPLVGSVRGARGGETALPALSDQVWKCIVSVGPMLINMRRTSTLEARCAIDGYRLFPPCSMVGIWNAAVLAIACMCASGVRSASVLGIAVNCPLPKSGTACGNGKLGFRSGLLSLLRYLVHQLVSNVCCMRFVSLNILLDPVAVLPGSVRN